jgi:DHA2 family multidrug resistance protein
VAGPSHAHAPPPLQGAALVAGTMGVALATFMTVLDSSIANVSVPAIAGDMGVSPTQGTWVITSFGVANAISVPLTGWLARRFGQVRLMIVCVLGFTLFSWLCGFAQSLETLIAARVLQGLAAGPMVPLSQTLLLSSYPPSRAGTALAASGVTVLVAPVVGPLLGGWITDNISWPWIFYINIPVGLLSALLIWSVHGPRESPHGPAPLDYAGLALLVIWVGSLQLMFDLGKERDWFESMEITALGLVALTGLLFFLAWELTDRHPVVDLSLFTGRSFLFGTISLSIAFGLFFGNAVILPIWLQQHMGYSAVWAGVSIAPMGVFAIMLSPWVGRLIGRVDPRLLSTISFSVYAAVLWLRSQFTVDVDIWTILVPTMLQGVATAFFFIPLQATIYAGLPLSRRPAAAGLSTFLRVSAGAFGTSAGTTLWEHRAAMHHVHLVEQIAAGHSEGARYAELVRELGLAGTQVAGFIDRVIERQAYTMAATDLFHLSSLIFLLLLVPIWCSAPPQRPTNVPATAPSAR